MATLLFRLNGVPDDEAADIRELLEQNDIEFYETDAGRWGISVAAIWLRDDTHLAQARQLIDAYEEERTRKARAAYEELRRENRHDTLLRRFLRQPVQIILYLAVIAGILYLMLAPFLHFG